MNRFMCMVVLLLAISVLVPTTEIAAQDDGSTVLREETEEQGVSKGLVIAFGKRLDPPYFVEFRNGQVLINDYVFSPREEDPSVRSRAIEVTPEVIERHNLLQSISAVYMANYQASGRDHASAAVVQEFQSHPLVKSLELDGDFLVVRFSEGNAEWVDLKSFEMAADQVNPTEEEKQATSARRVDELNERLRKGGLIAFGCQYTILADFSLPGQLEQAVADLSRGRTSREETEVALRGLLGQEGIDLLGEISTELDTWQ